MADAPTVVVDTNVLLNLATPVVDGRPRAPSGADPLKTVLTAYDVHVPRAVMGEVTEAAAGEDLLAAAATLVGRAAERLTTHDVAADIDPPLSYGLDRGESRGIWLANDLGAAMFVTDEFNTTNYLFVGLALADRNTLFTTPHVLCRLAAEGVLAAAYVEQALTYFVETKGWEGSYVSQLRARYFDE
jgi:hypothetical protein